MTENPSPEMPRPPQPPLQLHYAQAEPPIPFWDPRHVAFRIVRRLVFSIGCGLLAFGVISALAGVNRSDAPYSAAWGAGLIALNAPGWRYLPLSRR